MTNGDEVNLSHSVPIRDDIVDVVETQEGLVALTSTDRQFGGDYQIWSFIHGAGAVFRKQDYELVKLADQHILTLRDDNRLVQLWDLKGKHIANLGVATGDGASNVPIVSSSDEQLIVVLSDNGLQLWDFSGTLINEIPLDTKFIKQIALSHNGQVISLLFRDRVEFRYTSGQLIGEINDIQADQVFLDADGNRTAISIDSKLQIWNLSNREFVQLGQLNLPFAFGLWAQGFSADGQYVLLVENPGPGCDKCYSVPGIVQWWDFPAKQNTLEIQGRVLGFSADSQSLATVDGDSLNIWDLSGHRLSSMPVDYFDFDGFTLDSDNKFVAALTEDGTIRVWNFLTKQSHQFSINTVTTAALPEKQARIHLIRAIPNSDEIAIVVSRNNASDYEIEIRDITGVLVRRIPNLDEYGFGIFQDLIFGSQGDYFISIWGHPCKAGSYGYLSLFDRTGRNIVDQFNILSLSYYAFSFSPDGRHVLVSSDNRHTLLNQVGEMITLPEHGTSTASHSAFSQHIALEEEIGTIKLVDSSSGKLLKQWKAHNGDFRTLFSPDQKTLITLGQDKTAKFWDFTGTLLGQISIEITDYLAFSPSGKYFAISDGKKATKVFDAIGRQVAEFPAGRNLKFSPDERYLSVSMLDSRQVKMWRLYSLDELLEQGCQWLALYFETHPKSLEKISYCKNL